MHVVLTRAYVMRRGKLFGLRLLACWLIWVALCCVEHHAAVKTGTRSSVTSNSITASSSVPLFPLRVSTYLCTV